MWFGLKLTHALMSHAVGLALAHVNLCDVWEDALVTMKGVQQDLLARFVNLAC